AIVTLAQELSRVLTNNPAGVTLVEAKRSGAAFDLGMETNDGDARRFGFGHRRTEGAGIDEIDGDCIDPLVDEVFDGLDLLVHVAFTRGDDQLESGAAGSLLRAIDLAQMKG